MNTKIIIAATVAALSLATTAFAGEGNGSFSADVGSQHYPAEVQALSFNGVPTLPENGQNGAVQTANSLPVGFENGTVNYTQAQSVQRWYAQAADRRFALTQAAANRG